jgi:acyl-CoA thioester hydrolase
MRTNKALVSAQIEFAIPFFDVDAMSVTWHGHYVKYFEMARCALLDKIGYNYEDMKTSGFAWPVVDLRIKYVGPSKFNQLVVVHAHLVEYENRMKIEYVICDKATEKKLTKAYSVQVAVDMAKEEMCFVSPTVFTDKVEVLL